MSINSRYFFGWLWLVIALALIVATDDKDAWAIGAFVMSQIHFATADVLKRLA